LSSDGTCWLIPSHDQGGTGQYAAKPKTIVHCSLLLEIEIRRIEMMLLRP
jgi:hypothetical protein